MIETLEVLTYDIHKGLSSGHVRYVLPRLCEALAGHHADVALLQEIRGQSPGRRRNSLEPPGMPQYGYLAQRLEPYFIYGENTRRRSVVGAAGPHRAVRNLPAHVGRGVRDHRRDHAITSLPRHAGPRQTVHRRPKGFRQQRQPPSGACIARDARRRGCQPGDAKVNDA